MEGHVKILLEYEGAAPEVRELESVWATPVGDGYQIDNIPFYVREIALGDIVRAEKDDDGMLHFKSLVRPSGHSTVRLWFAKGREQDVELIRQKLRELGCVSELSDLPRLVAVDIPQSVPYERVRKFLDEVEKTGLLEYEEACLGFMTPNEN
jgi:Domain of unknown function (DUF4265)